MHFRKILLILLASLIAVTAVACRPSAGTDGRLHVGVRGGRNIHIEYNSPYIETGAFATFRRGSETTQLSVEITGDTVDTGKLGTYLLKYTARLGDRVATDYRRVNVVDTEKPQLKLVGAQYYTMRVGQPYGELGCTATDNYDGDLSSRVTVTTDLNPYMPGEYTVTYTATDSNKNATSITRTVCVEDWDGAVQMPIYGEPNGKVIYLTFDDGPSQHTERLLDVLKKYGVRATFFVVNTKFIDITKRIAAEGHTLALHTNSHVYKSIYASEDAYFQDLYAIRDTVKKLTGQEPDIIRFPGGSSNGVSSFNPGVMTRLTKRVEEEGFSYFDWTVDSKDTGGAKTPEAVFRNVAEGILDAKQNHSIILQHDIKGYSVDAVESIILWGLAQGYTFLPMDENTPTCHHTVRN